MNKTTRVPVVLILALFCPALGEKAQHPDTGGEGWIDLFNGKDFTGWMSAGGKKYDGLKATREDSGWVVKDGAMVLDKKGGNIWTQKRFGDFILDLEFKTTGNSGVLFRADKPRSFVQHGMEMQIERRGKPGNKHSLGAIYDCLAPTADVSGDKDWHRVTLTCRDNLITVVIDKKKIVEMDVNKWDTPRKNPDGSKNKFKKAVKDFKREGHIGLQDHKHRVMYRHIKIKPLEKK